MAVMLGYCLVVGVKAMGKGRNGPWLVNPLTNHRGHFRLREFENRDGLVMVHMELLRGLELLRADLCEAFASDVGIVVTDGVRTQGDLERLAGELGWLDEGGLVSRDSRHLAKYGGIAADIYAISNTRVVPHAALLALARRHFDFVKGYDTHVHVDQRERGA